MVSRINLHISMRIRGRVWRGGFWMLGSRRALPTIVRINYNKHNMRMVRYESCCIIQTLGTTIANIRRYIQN